MSDTPDEQQSETLFKFPCEYPVKVVGKQHKDETVRHFELAVLSIFEKHFEKIHEDAIEKRHSKDGNYLAITVTVTAQSKAQLDELYKDLTAHELVVWAL